MAKDEGAKPRVTVTLSNIGDGVALELFQSALDDVLRNIEDPNTDWRARRAIKLEVVFVPNEDRNMGDVEIKCSTRLAGMKGRQTLVYIGRDAGQLVAVEQPRQDQLFPNPGGKLFEIKGQKE